MTKKENLMLLIAVVCVVGMTIGSGSIAKLTAGQFEFGGLELQDKFPYLRIKMKEERKTSENLKPVSCTSYQEWEKMFKESNYNLDPEELNIPAWKIENIPEDMSRINNLNKRKQIFLRIVLVGAYHANYKLLKKKDKLHKIAYNFSTGKLTKEEKEWLRDKFYKYRVTGSSLGEKITNLEKKLDIVPLSLVIAQAACESGWGTSRFTKVANNIFGEWTFSSEEEGVIPKERPPGADYKIKKFSTIQASVESYLSNLNSHPAYKRFRKIRRDYRQRKEPLNSLKLAEGLINYSEQEELYVRKVKKIIKANDLMRFDKLLQKEE